MTEPGRASTGPLVSVVVPTCRRPALLGRCLRALAVQRFDRRDFEVIVVDDGCTEATFAATRAAGQEGLPVRYIASGPVAGPAAARNTGWRAALGEIIAFTDDDCQPARDWLRAGVDALGTGAEGACGRVVVPLATPPTDYERDAAGLEHGEFVTANCFYRRRALEAIGGFDPRFRIAWREDSDLFFGLLERGVRLVFAPAARVIHPVRPARWGVSLVQQRKNVFNALLYRKHPGLYRQRIQPSPPWRYYTTLVLLAAAGGSAWRGVAWLAGAAGAAWLGLTLTFCLRRLRGTSHAPAHVVEMLVTSALIPPVAIFWRLVGAARFRTLFF
jgi:GT2 family glycosyltransferase